MGLIDGYVDRVIGRTKSSIGQCGPVSLSYNATGRVIDASFFSGAMTQLIVAHRFFWSLRSWPNLCYAVDALCREVVDPFNGFWASVGWCVVLYLFSVALALPLVSLYRKSEPYPGPLVERNPTHGAGEDHQQRYKSSVLIKCHVFNQGGRKQSHWKNRGTHILCQREFGTC